MNLRKSPTKWKIWVGVYLTVVAMASALPMVTGDPLTAIVALFLSFPSSMPLVLFSRRFGLPGNPLTGFIVIGAGALGNIGVAYLLTRLLRRRGKN